MGASPYGSTVIEVSLVFAKPRQNGHRPTIARCFRFSYTRAMSPPLLSPGAADALLFDLGRVVLDIDFNNTLARWAVDAGCTPADLAARFPRDETYLRHERGEISDAEFFAGLRTSLGVGLSDAQFLDGWNAIFIGEMPGIALQLARAARRLPLYAFSNTNPAHAEYLTKTYAGVLGHFREIFLSPAIGLRKPDTAAYDHVVKAIGVPAARIVFFDDSADNIEGARNRGLQAVHVTSPDDVAGALGELGI
jgi:putative hydrolase of the HAD superfamily